MDIDHALHFFDAYGKSDYLKLEGVHMHIGSPIYSAEPYVKAIEKMTQLIETLTASGFPIKYLDVGPDYPVLYFTHVSGLETPERMVAFEN